MKKRNRGITLIVLVITIIVLLILAGVSIATLTGDSGLIQKAITAKEENEKAKELELIRLAVSAAQVEGQGTITTDNLNKELKSQFNNNKVLNEYKEFYIYEANRSYKIYKSGKVEGLEGLEDVEDSKSVLSPEYQQVEYIESTGEQYFLLDLVSTANFGFEIEQYVSSGTGVNVFGGYSGDGFYCYMGIRDNKISYIPSKYYKCDFTSSTDYNEKHSYKVIFKGGYLSYSYDDNQLGTVRLSNDANCSIAVFSFVDQNGVIRSSKDETFTGRIYKFLIYDNETVVCNLIPCYRKSDNEAGMYDIINNKFYTSQGTEKFLKGNDI